MVPRSRKVKPSAQSSVMNTRSSIMTVSGRPVVLCILDGWGCRTGDPDDAITFGRTPVFDRMMEQCAHAVLHTSGAEVGLPEGQMGNSEVGHTNLGGGRIVKQALPRIDEAVRAGSFSDNSRLIELIRALKQSGGTCHVMGLLSPGGVHSHQRHILALVAQVSAAGVPVCVHAFLDGRDTPPQSAKEHLTTFCAGLEKLSDTSVATLCGRYYAMDRDQRWDRIATAYEAVVLGRGVNARDPLAALEESYRADITDEFLVPAVLGDYQGMADGDAILMANFRADRAREILTALLDPNFDGFDRKRMVAFVATCGMVAYSSALDPLISTLFPSEKVEDSLGEVVSRAGLKQLRIAETEKYAHVTFFFNGGSETVFPGEDRILVPSPKVPTYDLQPEMSAVEVTDELVAAIADGKYDFIVANYANPDMVGHTGKFDAAVKAVETVDSCLGRLCDAVRQAGGTLFITADHGNIERMRDRAGGQPHTAHTTNRVPAILAAAPGLVDGPRRSVELMDGRLADVAPTLLQFLGLPQPESMTGRSLIIRTDAEPAAPASGGTQAGKNRRP